MAFPHASRLLSGVLAVGTLLATAIPAGALEPYQQTLDITFPTVASAVFGMHFDAPRSGGRVHKATDVMAPKHSPAYAVTDGTICYINGIGEPMPSWGYSFTLCGDDGRKYKYLHMNNDTPGTDDGNGGAELAYAPGIVRGVRVARGQHVGWVGDSGNAENSGSHIHFEIEDPAVTDPYGDDHIDPYYSLTAAIARGDVATGSVPAPSSERQPTLTPKPTVTPVATAGTCDDRQATGFADTIGNVHEYHVRCIVDAEITRGRADGTYSPRATVSHGQVATFLVRTLTAAGVAVPDGADVADAYRDDDGDTHEGSLDRLAAIGLPAERSDRARPNEPVTRAEMAAWVGDALRYAGVEQADPDDFYRDDEDHPLQTAVNRLSALGVVTGTGDGTFAPDATLNRAQMATFLARSLAVLER